MSFYLATAPSCYLASHLATLYPPTALLLYTLPPPCYSTTIATLSSATLLFYALPSWLPCYVLYPPTNLLLYPLSPCSPTIQPSTTLLLYSHCNTLLTALFTHTPVEHSSIYDCVDFMFMHTLCIHTAHTHLFYSHICMHNTRPLLLAKRKSRAGC